MRFGKFLLPLMAMATVLLATTSCNQQDHNNHSNNNPQTDSAVADAEPAPTPIHANSATEPVAEANKCSDRHARLHAAVDDSRRLLGNLVRDEYRHPVDILSFFELDPRQTVVEIWPSGGWWTEILAPYLRDCGQYIAAGYALDAKRTPGWRKRIQGDYNSWLASHADRFDQIQVTSLSIPERPEIAPAGSADRVLTFRNVHNWMNGDYAPAVFESMFAALKPGGMMGLVEHRANPGTSLEQMLQSGYITEAMVVEMAVNAGFELVSRSEINANPKDTKNHPQGVWSLPPSFRGGEDTRDKYQAIGESDRMTLLFRKPE